MNKISPRLKEKKFRFCLLSKHDVWQHKKTKKEIRVAADDYKKFNDNEEYKALGKIPFEFGWQSKKNYQYNDKQLLVHPGNIGVVCGHGGLLTVDFDDKKFQDKFAPLLPKTFTVKTGSGLLHKYFICDDPKGFRILDENKETLADIQGRGTQVVAPGCTHPNGKRYVIVDNSPIAEIKQKNLRILFNDYLKEKDRVKTTHPKDNIVEQIKSKVSLKQMLDHYNYDTSRHPTMCKLGHSSKGGSCFSFNEELWNCFHCDEGGDVFSLVMAHENCDFVEAKRKLMKIAGIGQTLSTVDKPTIKELELLNNPNILELYNKQFDKKIVGEEESRKSIFLNACGKFVANASIASYNLCLSSNSGAGKDYTTKGVLKIFPPEDVVIRSRISPTVFTYWHNAKFEPDWSWEGKICLLSDISNSILNHEVFKLMCSDGTHSTVVMKQQAVDILIKGKPVLFITTASANPNNEMLRRFPMAEMDETIKQTKEIKRRQAIAAATGESLDYEPVYTNALRKLKRVKVKIPFAEKLIDFFPDDHIIMRTHFQRLLDYIKASAAFFQYQRKSSEDYVIAEPLDYDNATIPLKVTTSNPMMIPLSKKQKMLLKVCKKMPIDFTIKELEPKVPFLVQSKIYDYVTKLHELGFLTCWLDDSSKRPVRKYNYVKFEIKNIPRWEDIVAGLGELRKERELREVRELRESSPDSPPKVHLQTASSDEKQQDIEEIDLSGVVK